MNKQMIVVYFVNNCSAKFSKDEIVFVRDGVIFPDDLNIGKTLINWRNVCFVRDVPDTPYVGLTN